MRIIDRISAALAALAAWLFVVTGVMLSYEVLARYFFNAPTVWAAELSQLLLIWATFLAAAGLLKDDRHIAITMLTARLGPRARRASEALTLTAVCVFAAWIAWHGFAIFYDSWERGRSTGTMMNLPNWITEAVLPVAFALLALQALSQLLRLPGKKFPE